MKRKRIIKPIWGITLLIFLGSIQSIYSQIVNIDITGLDTTLTLDPYVIGQPYNVVIHPQNVTGDLTWEVTSSLSANSGRKMQVNSTDLTTTITITPNGSIEDIHFVDNGNPPVENGLGYLFEVVATDDGSNEVVLTLRLPVMRAISVVLVLDRSGSMGWAPHGGSGSITRMDILQTAASLFINKLDAIDITGDQGALTYFQTTVDNPPPGFGNTLTAIAGNATNFTNDITSQSPGGSTAMGGGLLAAKTKLASAASDNRQFVFLFTDGEQNVAPLVNNAGTDAGTESLNNIDKSIQIVTIGTGAAAGMAPAILLQEIAEMNTGVNPPANGTPRYFLLQEEVNPSGSGTDFNTLTGIANFFDQGFESMLGRGSPQTVDVRQGISSSGSASTQEFIINANIDLIFFELITPDQEPFFTIEKDGIPVTQNNASLEYIYGPNNGTNSLLAVLNLAESPSSGLTSAGTWTINIRSGTGGNKPYQMKAQVDDHRLDYTFEVEADQFKVEDILRFKASLMYDGNPIEDADISLLVLKPGEDLGDLLARADVKYDPSGTPEAGSIGYQKLLAAIQNNPDLIDSLNLKENTVILSHSGDGNYGGQFSDTDVSSVYQVIGSLSGSDETIGDYRRLIRRTVYLRFGDPDPEISDQQHTQVNNNTTIIQYTPKYKVGNQTRFIGPGFGQGFDIVGEGVSIDEILDNGNGSYSITIIGDPDTEIELNLAGVEVYKGQVDGKEGFCNWVERVLGIPCWVAIIIIIVIVVIIIVIRRKSGNP